MRPVTARVTVANPIAYVRLDQYHGAALAVQAVIETGGGGNSAQAIAYLARTVGGNEGGNAANITTLINGLVADGVWAKLDALYVFAQQNQTDALLNLVSTSYNSTIVGTGVVFATYRGFSGFNTANGYLQTGFNPTTAPSPNYTLNNANYGVWANSVAGNNTFGEMGDGAGIQLNNDYAGNAFYGRVNDASTQITSPATDGLYVADRALAANAQGYYNGSLLGTFGSSASVSLNSFTITIGFVATTGTSELISEAHIGGSLGATLQLALYNRLRTYMTAVGVP